MIKHRLLTVLSVFLLAIGAVFAQSAPASSDSPYSDQKYISPDEPAWYETPILWIGLALLIIVSVVLYVRNKKKRYT